MNREWIPRSNRIAKTIWLIATMIAVFVGVYPIQLITTRFVQMGNRIDATSATLVSAGIILALLAANFGVWMEVLSTNQLAEGRKELVFLVLRKALFLALLVAEIIWVYTGLAGGLGSVIAGVLFVSTPFLLEHVETTLFRTSAQKWINKLVMRVGGSFTLILVPFYLTANAVNSVIGPKLIATHFFTATSTKAVAIGIALFLTIEAFQSWSILRDRALRQSWLYFLTHRTWEVLMECLLITAYAFTAIVSLLIYCYATLGGLGGALPASLDNGSLAFVMYSSLVWIALGAMAIFLPTAGGVERIMVH